MYNKMRNCAHTDKDSVTKMFAYKQMGYAFCQLEKYESAIISFKHMLALAWTIKSCEGELAAYEGLALMYLYTGQIEKCKFYDARITNGAYEPHDSQLYKISISSTLNENRWLKDSTQIQNRQTYLELAQEKAEDMSRAGTHLVNYFSERLRDYSLLKTDTIRALTEVTAHFEICHKTGQHDIMVDPSTQYLETCPNIGTPRYNRGLGQGLQRQM